MIKALKRNQIVIFAIALMLITAGYLNYSMQTEQTAETWSELESNQIAGIGDARLVSSNDASSYSSAVSDIVQNDEVAYENEDEDESIGGDESYEDSKEQVSETSSKNTADNDKYFSESRLEREKMYSEMLDSYQSMIANSSTSYDQKNSAQTEIRNINSQRNAIMIAENLIKNKGFEDIIIFVNNGSVSVVVRAESLNEAEIAQIQSIVQRELVVEVQNIHISNK